MNKSMKTLIAGAAMAGLCSGAYAVQQGSTTTGKTTVNAGINLKVLDKGTHDCKGQNDCKGQGGCKSGDNGCKGKNSCKGKGGCASK